MRPIIYLGIFLFIAACSGNPESTATDVVEEKTETEVISDDKTNAADTLINQGDSIAEVEEIDVEKPVVADTATNEEVDPRIQRIIDEKINKEILDSINKNK